jgi:hypothetical protein
MNVGLIQTNNENYSADFDIIDDKNRKLGQLHYETKSKYKDTVNESGEWQGKIFGKQISMMINSTEINKKTKTDYCCPCTITINGNKRGSICQRTARTGLFSSYDFYEMQFGYCDYKLYPISFGEDGAKNPVYSNDVQIALIEKNAIVVDDLHNYYITSVDQFSSMIAILLSCYMYALVSYKHGTKITQSIEKYYFKNINKYLLSKYNPDFKLMHNGNF